MSYRYSCECNHYDTDENYPEVLCITTVYNVNYLSYKISGYFKVPFLKKKSLNFDKSLFEMIEKSLYLLNSINFKHDANLKHIHSKSFVKFLNQKVKDNSDILLSNLNLSDFVSSAQTELELPSSASTSLTLYNAVLNSVDWWTDLLNLFIDFVNSLAEYEQNSKIDRILECNFDAKKFNRLLGDALNYARKHNNLVVVPRNDQEYIDLSPDNQVSLDWDGGLPALFNHRHYNFDEFLERFYDNGEDKYFLSDHLYANWLGKELKEFPEYGQ